MTAINRSGSFTVDAPVEDTVADLADRDSVVRCLPDHVESVNPREDAVAVTLAVGVPNITTRLRLRLTVTTDNTTNHVRYTGHGTAARSRVELTGDFTVHPDPTGSRVDWTGEARINGVLAALGETPGQYDGIVDRKIETAIDNLTEALTP